MKRFISWVVLAVCSYVSLVLCDFIRQIIISIAYRISMSGLAIVLLVLFGGAGALAAVSFALFLLAGLTASLSDSVQVSEKGTRYKVAGWIIVVLYGLSLLGVLFGLVKVQSTVSAVVGNIIYCIYGFFLLAAAHTENRIMWKK